MILIKANATLSIITYFNRIRNESDFRDKFFHFLLLNLVLLSTNVIAAEVKLSPEAAKDLVKTAVNYALTNNDPNMDYSKYVSKNFMNPIDGKIFNYQQWVTHQKNIKAIVKSMVPRDI